jgi:mono/diheme cytochrome c family protein
MRAAIAILILLLTGCDEQSMVQQNRYRPYEKSTLWANGTEAQPLPANVVAQGDLARDAALKRPPEMSTALIEHGRERFNIYCSPCHGLSGAGDGMIVQRGFPAPPSYHIDRLRQAPAQHFMDVMNKGFGVMYPYGTRLEPRDRWAIVAYIRTLQTSEHTQLTDVPDAREKLP